MLHSISMYIIGLTIHAGHVFLMTLPGLGAIIALDADVLIITTYYHYESQVI